ncbi:MAG: preprotein translocase subunit SecA [Candidatus Neomarinimicrobiota bacterium]|nr:MAG: preprotein translocase subunit SecA [Candidatus Neomarinimicrobiota bacterium]
MGVLKLLTKVFGTANERELKRLQPLVERINEIYKTLHDLPMERLRQRTEEFKEMIRQAREEAKKEAESVGLSEEEKHKFVIRAEQKVLDEILPEAFAMVKEVCRRLVGQEWTVVGQKVKWDMIPFDVQLMGAIVLHQGKIAEMKTGEGKTLVATMPAYLNALTGRGVHSVTVKDYLAQRDREWMGKIYEELGLTVGCILNSMDTAQRREAYNCDITYGTNNEFGFDYLRDNMALSVENQVQRGHYYAIVDEVDSVLIDEARTPLIISGPVSSSRNRIFKELNPAVSRLVKMQMETVTKMLSAVPDNPEKVEDEKAVARTLFIASQGMPKHRRLRRLLEEPYYKKLLQEGEKEYLLLTSSKSGASISQDEYFEDLYYFIEEKQNNITLTAKGEEKLASLLGISVDELVIPDLAEEFAKIDEEKGLSEREKELRKLEIDRKHSEISDRYHNISQLLRAYTLFEKDVEYVVQDGKVLIVDEFTGRILPGRRYSDGLHQAIEAKEGVEIEEETQTFATITLQNYFRMYDKLAGMTGTAETEAQEFHDIYKLDVVVIPTNKPCIRIDYDDQVYKTKREKYNAIIKEIEECHRRGQPVLVGTISVEVSETLSRMLKRRGIPHNVLNAKHHKREAEIVARAGEKGAVTIATNMAGRGTDIKLGEGVKELGGLHIIGTERHEARRIDLQLRGRAGRQGDPGSSRFFLSLEDDLMRLFGSERIASIMDRLGIEEGQVITHPMITRSIERAQKKVEARNFSIRKRLLEFDDVLNQQREVIYKRRNYVLQNDNLKSMLFEMLEDWIDLVIEKYTRGKEHPEDWDWNGLSEEVFSILGIGISVDELSEYSISALKRLIIDKAVRYYEHREQLIGPENMRQLEKFVILRTIDDRWKDHLYFMDQLREGINWRAYAQKDPLLEYKAEGFNAFVEMLDEINREALRLCFRVQIGIPEEEPRRRRPVSYRMVHEDSTGLGFVVPAQETHRPSPGMEPPMGGAPGSAKRVPIRVSQKVGRNDPCPCGSGKKYKKCCGRNL